MSAHDPHDPWQTMAEGEQATTGRPHAAVAETVPAPGDRLGSYELLAALGKGGMGAVFRARHAVLKKDFALKVLSPRLARDADATGRFRREAEALGRLEDAHLVRATDAGVSDGVPFIVMELLDGVDLDRLTRNLGRWPVAEACAAIRQAALGLQHAHERGLIHRDIKPSNLWLTPGGVVKVLDLGLARLRDEDGGAAVTSAGAWMGTPDYIAPEQILDSHGADIRADLYSLGCTLFALLSGEAPFGSSSHPTLRQKSEAHLSEPPPDIRRRRPDVPAGLADVLARLLAKRPEDRYQTPAEAAAALQPLARGARLEALSGGEMSSTVTAATHTDGGALTTPQTARPGTTRRVRAVPRWLGVAAAVVLLAGVGGAAVLISHRDRPPAEPSPSAPPETAVDSGAGQRPRPEAESPPRAEAIWVLSLDVKHFPTVDGRSAPPLRMGRESFAARLNDSVTVEARLSRPAYAFLIAFRPDGTDDVCFPEKDDVPPPLTDRPRYPSVSAGFNYGLEEGTGLQAFALVVSSRPLPSYKEWRAHCPPPVWGRHRTPADVVWRADGAADVEALTADNPGGRRERGKHKEVEGKTPLARLAGWLRAAPQAETVQVLGFAVTPKEMP